MAELQRVAVGQTTSPLDDDVVQRGAVSAVQVFDKEALSHLQDASMVPAHRIVGNHDVTVRISAQNAFLSQRKGLSDARSADLDKIGHR